MKTSHITSLLLLAAAIPATAANVTEEIASYVYPGNVADRPAPMSWMADGKSYASLTSDGRQVVRYDIASGKQLEVLFDAATARGVELESIESFKLSPTEGFMLVNESSEAVYRRSSKAAYYIFDIRHNKLTPLSEQHPRQQSPLWSPDGRIIAFVADNNIYMHKLDYGTEVAVTTDGEVNKVINGVPDWVYEEEFSTSCSMAWSPDNLTFSYLRYDESRVPLYSFPLYQGTCRPIDSYALYPGAYTYKYPVAGQPNSTVTLHSYDVETRKTKKIDFADSRIEYIPRIEYAGSAERLIVATLNRDQNRLELYSVNPKSTVYKSIYVDEVSGGWIDPMAYENLHIYDDFFVISSERSGYNHFYQYSYAGAEMRQLTSGDFDVSAYLGYDPVKKLHYYQAAAPTPLDRTVSCVDIKGKTTLVGAQSGTTSLNFAPGMNFASMSFSDVNTPPVYTICNPQGKTVRTLADNASLAARCKSMPRREFFKVSSDGYELNAYIVKPLDFNPSRKYPVIMSQYSGPGSQSVCNRWSLDWEQYYASKGYIVVCVDGRGTGFRGREFKQIVYRRLGHFESIDQIAAAKYMRSQPYAGKVGIYGWSYGGYESLLAASLYGYDAAVAVAPVTSWRYYDTIYTERYMTTPGQNPDGYDEGAPISYVDRVTTPLLIMHGTADDNVHLMNTIQYVSELQGAGKLCDMLLFPNMNHSINGCNSRALVYANMLRFFDANLR